MPRNLIPSKNQQFTSFLFGLFRDNKYDYTQGNLRRGMAVLAVPMVLEMSMEAVFSIVDVFFVAGLGIEAVAALGFTEALLTLIYALAFGLGFPVAALIARRVGESKPDQASEIAVQANIIGIGLAVATCVPGFLFASDLLRWMGASDAVATIGSSYTALLLGSNVVIQLLFINGAIFRGAGDPTIAMKALAIANGFNVLLDPCLIFGLGPFPELGLLGAALATTIGRSIGVLYLLTRLYQGSNRIRVERRHLVIRLKVIKKILSLSIGGIGQSLVETLSWVVLVRILATFGSAAVAGYTIALRILIFSILPTWGIGNAVATLVGQNLGAKQTERARHAVILGGWYATCFMGVCLVVFVSFSELWIGMFTKDPAVIRVGAQALSVLSCGNLLYAWEVVLMQAFNGAGNTMVPFRINLLCLWMIKLPLAYFLSHIVGFGESGIWYAALTAYSLASIIALWVFRSGNWMRYKL